MTDREPNLVTSRLSRHVTRDSITVEVFICRLEEEPQWSLQVVNAKGASIVWDDTFDTDDAANAEFLRTVDDEGMAAFLDTANVLPFRR